MKEQEIRPQEVFNTYLDLCKKDVITYFNGIESNHILCPACDSKGEFTFKKDGFCYEVCPKCNTIFNSPRPIKSAFDNFYISSPSSKYWAEVFYDSVKEIRREKLWKPKAKEIKQIIEKFKNINSIIDIGAGYGIFNEEIVKLMKIDVVNVEPSEDLVNVLKNKGLNVIDKVIEEVSHSDIARIRGGKCFISFELFEHLHDPYVFLNNIYKLMDKEDVIIFTTLSGLGLDIQLLWEHSKSISPPHHINFINPYSAKILIERVGLSIVDIKTPGKLDMDILSNNQKYIKDRFWKNYLKYSSAESKSKMQAVISETLFSSHIWVIARK